MANAISRRRRRRTCACGALETWTWRVETREGALEELQTCRTPVPKRRRKERKRCSPSSPSPSARSCCCPPRSTRAAHPVKTPIDLGTRCVDVRTNERNARETTRELTRGRTCDAGTWRHAPTNDREGSKPAKGAPARQ